MEVYDSEKTALDALNCNHRDLKPPTLLTVDSDVEEVKDFIKREERMKMEDEMQGDDPRNNYIDPNIYAPLPLPPTTPGSQRGDIPATDIESCDGKNKHFNSYGKVIVMYLQAPSTLISVTYVLV